MENMYDVYSNQPENAQWDNPIHNKNIDSNRFTLIEEGLNRSLMVNRSNLVFKLITTLCGRLFLFLFICLLILVLTLVTVVALKKANLR